MSTRDLHSSVNVLPCVDPAAIWAGNTTKTGATIDTAGYDSHEFVCVSGVMTDSTITWTLYEGDASDMSDETAVAAADMLGSPFVFISTTDSAAKRFGYRGNKRYLRIKGVQTGATTGGYAMALCVQSHPHVAPVA